MIDLTPKCMFCGSRTLADTNLPDGRALCPDHADRRDQAIQIMIRVRKTRLALDKLMGRTGDRASPPLPPHVR